MKTKTLLICMGLLLILALVSAISVQAGSSKTLILDWRQVVPSGSGDPNMFGEATINVNAGQSRLCYTLQVLTFAGIDWPPTGASIRKAPFGANGPLVVDLQPDFSSSTNASGCLNINSALAHDIQRSPAQYYLLVTNSTHPDGAARAQLTK